MCRLCDDERIDYGFDLPDERDRVPLKGTPCGECECCLDGDDCDVNDREYVTVRIVRKWKACPCGEGSTFDVAWRVTGPDGDDPVMFNDEDRAYAYIDAAYGDRVDEEYAQADAEYAAVCAAERRFGC